MSASGGSTAGLGSASRGRWSQMARVEEGSPSPDLEIRTSRPEHGVCSKGDPDFPQNRSWRTRYIHPAYHRQHVDHPAYRACRRVCKKTSFCCPFGDQTRDVCCNHDADISVAPCCIIHRVVCGGSACGHHTQKSILHTTRVPTNTTAKTAVHVGPIICKKCFCREVRIWDLPRPLQNSVLSRGRPLRPGEDWLREHRLQRTDSWRKCAWCCAFARCT